MQNPKLAEAWEKRDHEHKKVAQRMKKHSSGKTALDHMTLATQETLWTEAVIRESGDVAMHYDEHGNCYLGNGEIYRPL